MLTIKAFARDNSVTVFEAFEITGRQQDDRTIAVAVTGVAMTPGNSGVQRYTIDCGPGEGAYERIVAENQSGKTVFNVHLTEAGAVGL